MGKLNLAPPEPLTERHDLAGFRCGRPEMDDWLSRRALWNEVQGHSRTYVLCEAGSAAVVGYYSLSSGGLARRTAPKPLQRNAPDPIPVILLGRLAVNERVRLAHRGLGGHLLRDAFKRAAGAAVIIGARALMVHALDDAAEGFYRRHHFSPAPGDPRLLMIGFEAIRRAFSDAPTAR